MADPSLARSGRGLQSPRQGVDAAHVPRDGEVAAPVKRRDAGAVVPAILQAAQSLHQEIGRLTMPNVSDDATHVIACSIDLN
jgi:hypothetical protein